MLALGNTIGQRSGEQWTAQKIPVPCAGTMTPVQNFVPSSELKLRRLRKSGYLEKQTFIAFPIRT